MVAHNRYRDGSSVNVRNAENLGALAKVPGFSMRKSQRKGCWSFRRRYCGCSLGVSPAVAAHLTKVPIAGLTQLGNDSHTLGLDSATIFACQKLAAKHTPTSYPTSGGCSYPTTAEVLVREEIDGGAHILFYSLRADTKLTSSQAGRELRLNVVPARRIDSRCLVNPLSKRNRKNLTDIVVKELGMVCRMEAMTAAMARVGCRLLKDPYGCFGLTKHQIDEDG
ncbi:hypothetical protein BKA58DRAFT_188036 [Alternaria rosae]|uniref:uncharacterized protein n=1 Tax=Alternaria rosae TaxID=1187941 RepID=UPI001E8E694B|nr:uncharacterized protein BKA58DRAFT_188036 [Alternaria rosae]KAH6868073.1 hypothetical protein BKA58DRAFT_188036 [Alternaria rosae]